jgi:hypothetical protein
MEEEERGNPPTKQRQWHYSLMAAGDLDFKKEKQTK